MRSLLTHVAHGSARTPVREVFRWGVVALAVATVAGCASSRQAQRSPERSEIPVAEDTRLPGSERRYPTQENAVREGTSEAFPPVVQGGASPGPGRDRGGRPAGDAVAGAESRTDAGAGGRAGDGTGRDRVRATPPPTPDVDAVAVDLAVQLYAGGTEWAARDRVAAWAAMFHEPLRIDEEDGLFKVRMGRFATREEAERAQRAAAASGLEGAFIVEVPRE